MNEYIYTIENDKIVALLSKEHFEKEPILEAIYEYANLYYINMQPYENKFVKVVFEAKQKADLLNDQNDKFIKNFINKVIDYQLKKDLEKKYGHIRDIIIEYAYSPVKKK